MKKIVDRLLKYFYNTKIGEYYIYLILWYDNVKFRREVKKRSPAYSARIVCNATQMAYEQGLKVVRRKVSDALKSYDPTEFDATLRSFEEGLLDLADGTKSRGDEIRADILWRAYVKPSGIDVSNELDKARMIQDRISDYMELQNHKLKRDLMRKIRKAGTSGDQELLEQLQREFNAKFGRSKTRHRKV